MAHQARHDTISQARLAADRRILAQIEIDLVAQSQERDNYRLQLAEIQRAVLQADADVRDLIIQRDLLKKSISRRNATLASHSPTLSTLPHEVLGMIFKNSIDGYDNNIAGRTKQPFQCAAVCKRWRSAALDISSLWTYIGVPRFQPGTAGKRWHTLVQHLLRRSGTCALHVVVSLSDDDNVFRSSRSILYDLMRHCSRWRHFELHGHALDETRIETLGLLRGRTPLLETVLFCFTQPFELRWPEEMPEYLPYAPMLRHASFSNVPIAFDLGQSTVHSAHAGLSATSLSLRDHVYDLARVATTVMSFPALTTLEILWADCEPSNWTITASPIRLPELLTLKFSRADNDNLQDYDSISHIMDALEAPKLRVLDMVPELLPCAEVLIDHCAATVEVLHLRNGSVQDMQDASILESLDGLREISFSWVALERAFFIALRNKAAVVWPKLERIVLGYRRQYGVCALAEHLPQFLRTRYPVNATAPSACALLQVDICADNDLAGSVVAAEIQHILDNERERRDAEILERDAVLAESYGRG